MRKGALVMITLAFLMIPSIGFAEGGAPEAACRAQADTIETNCIGQNQPQLECVVLAEDYYSDCVCEAFPDTCSP